jgi:hypothetical protein
MPPSACALLSPVVDLCPEETLSLLFATRPLSVCEPRSLPAYRR